MKTKYNPKEIEQPIYEYWEEQGYFHPHGNTSKESFCIMLPPPNITGNLHMGHAFQQTIMDILIRYNRMQGKNTLWQVGTDHAGIATQIIIERKLALQCGEHRKQFGRKNFINHVWHWSKTLKPIIINQMKRLGNSADWQRERFTMDSDFSLSVTEAFILLYKEGLIYRGKRLVNWDPILETAISDLEVNNRIYKGSMWYIRYPFANKNVSTLDGKNYMVVATTRPETIFGDTAIVVHPTDQRYKSLIGQLVNIPLLNRCIPIISDKQVDMSIGTGCMKITPAHDFKDYEIGHRYDLPIINIFNLNGTIRTSAEIVNYQGKIINIPSVIIPIDFHNLERTAARKKIIIQLKQIHLLEKIQDHNFMMPYSDRSGALIEPILTDQWYICTKSMAKMAIEAVKQKRIQFIPKTYENLYFSWMHDIQDWCISRSLWWGHRIPVWYDLNGNIFVGKNEKEVRLKNNLDINLHLNQDNDVLDTWFSSALWTFATLGWPKHTDALDIFHPTNILVSGFDIIFFWIARMIMFTMHFLKDKQGKPQIPFKTVYITGLIKDEEGNKMSKSKGNVIDPLDIIDGISLEALLKKRTENLIQPKLANKIIHQTKKKFPFGIKPYGTDALRFTLAALSSNCRDIHWDMKRLEGYRNFCNKLWNAARFILQQHININDNPSTATKNNVSLIQFNRWIKSELNITIKNYRDALDNYRFDLASNIIYEFTWNQYCDWYLEIVKLTKQNYYTEFIKYTYHTMIEIFESILLLAHPIMPFITETLWQRLKNNKSSSDTIMLQPFPNYDSLQYDHTAIIEINFIKKIVTAIRNIRAEMNLPLNTYLKVFFRKINNLNYSTTNIDYITIINNYTEFLCLMAHLSTLKVWKNNFQMNNCTYKNKIVSGIELLVPLTGIINQTIELERITKKIDKLSIKINKLEKLFLDEAFLSHAPTNIILKNREQLNSYLQEKQLLEHQQQKLLKEN
ncbi:MAG: valine--tRNA ligase [Candidatus Dasytiphilus stammeri]